jgi:GTP-binding protein Era
VSQKGIVIGRQGAMLKEVGSRARQSIETLLGKKVFLRLWVKNKEGWQNDPKIIASFYSTY